MGGTFNPIHNAHLMLAKLAYEQFELDEVMFLPTKQPAYKDLDEVANEIHRKRMIELAIRGNSHFSLNTMEYERKGNTYTADTLELLKEQNPKTEYFFIVGADSLFSIEKWYRPDQVMRLSHIVAAQRDDKEDDKLLSKIEQLIQNYHAKVELLRMPKMDISSKMIRTCLQEGKSIQGLVPEDVYEYIIEHHLYRE